MDDLPIVGIKLDGLLQALQTVTGRGQSILRVAPYLGFYLDLSLIDPPEPVNFAGSGFSASFGTTPLVIQTLDRDGIYRIVAHAAQGTVPAAGHPWDLQFFYEGSGSSFMNFRRFMGQAIAEVGWDYVFFLKKNWIIKLLNVIAYGVGENSAYEYNIFRYSP